MRLLLGDLRDVLPTLEAESLDACVTDCPYELGFMGKTWDSAGVSFQPETWAHVLRVLKPGGHLLAFGGTRTYHRIAVAVEDAGFEVRDQIAWMYGSGFPKSLDVAKAYEPGSEEARRWQGWGTALKPAYEPVVVARKPLEGTVAGNVLAHGVGAINVDACRIGYEDASDQASAIPGGRATAKSGALAGGTENENERSGFVADNSRGRWPANVVLGHSPDCVPAGTRTVEVWDCVPGCPVRLLDEQTGELRSGPGAVKRQTSDGWQGNAYGVESRPEGSQMIGYADAGGASRFFYCSKTSRAERNAGLEGFEARFAPTMGNGIGGKEHDPETATPKRNGHPTVKPIDLMRWLLRLVVPPGGTVLDPFLGSGSTGCAAALEGYDLVGVELDPEYLRIAEARIAFWAEHGEDGLRIVAERAAGERARTERAATGQLDLLGGAA